MLVEDRVYGQCCLAGLPVADDQFALPAPDRHQRIHDLQAGVQRLVHWCSLDDIRCVTLQVTELCCLNRPALIQGLTQRIHHPAQQLVSYRYAYPLTGGGYQVSALDPFIGSQQDHVNIGMVQVENQALDTGRKSYQFVGAGARQARERSHAVADLLHGTHFMEANLDG